MKIHTNQTICRKLVIPGILFLFIGAFVVPSMGSNIPFGEQSRGTLYVGGTGPGNYTTIQDAVDNATPGDTIYVYSGIYTENVFVLTSVTLQGENHKTTIIDAGGAVYAVAISVDGVTVTGFTIQNSGPNYEGIAIYSNENLIYRNIIKDNYFGVRLAYASYNAIVENVIHSNSNPGIYLGEISQYNTIQRNYIFNNYYAGVMLAEECHYNQIIGNTIAHNDRGLYLFNSYLGCAYYNEIYHNNFIDNTVQARDDCGGNTFDDGYPSGGNYWSDYDEPAEGAFDNFKGPSQNISGSDGIVDTRYLSGTVRDYYPFMNPSCWEDVCREFSYVTLTAENHAGLTTCPAKDVSVLGTEIYEHVLVTVKNTMGLPIVALPASEISFIVTPGMGCHYYNNLSCTFTPVDPVTNFNGEIRFTVQGDTSIQGYITIAAEVKGILLIDRDDLLCNSYDQWISMMVPQDGVVALQDFGKFASDYGTMNWESDYNWGGMVDLVDFGLFASHWGHHA